MTDKPTATASKQATKRLLRELETWETERASESGIERLGPVSEDDLFTWEAVVNGQGVGNGYDGRLCPLLLSRPPYPVMDTDRG